MSKPTGRAHIYCRVSSQGQEDGSSLDTQEAACRAWAEERGLVVASAVREVWSGGDRHRPELDALLGCLLPGDVVLAYALDRLSRSQVDTAILIDRIEGAGATLALVTEDFERSATGTFLRNAKAFVAEMEREKIKARTWAGLRARVASGKPLPGAKAPYGYRWDDAAKSRLVHDPETAGVVRFIFDRALEGVALRQISHLLAEQGIPAPSGAALWHASSIRELLRRPTYTGTVVTCATKRERQANGGTVRRPATAEERVILPGIAEPIVTPEEFAAVAAGLERNQATATRHNRHPELALLRAGFIVVAPPVRRQADPFPCENLFIHGAEFPFPAWRPGPAPSAEATSIE